MKLARDMRLFYQGGKETNELRNARIVTLLAHRYGTGQWMTLSEIDQAYLEGLYDAGLEEVASLLYELRKYSLVKIKIDI
jgi:hypothetical protein